MRMGLLLTAVMMIPFDGCQDGGVICTEIFVYGVNVDLTDASDGSVIEGATLTLMDGDYMETMEEIGMGDYAGAGERAGTYTLLVEAEGFEDATRENIVVTGDVCHVMPVTLQVEMTPVTPL